jgi:V/A-type H+-transporting ATPase subunit I
MAIERMKTVWLFDPLSRERELLDRLAAMGVSHVTAPELPDDRRREAMGVGRVYPEVGDLDRRVQLLRDTLEVLTRFSKTSRDFLENFIATPVEVKSDEVRKALEGLDEAAVHHHARELDRRHAALIAALEKARERRKALQVYAGLPFTVPGAKQGGWVRGWAGRIGAEQFRRLKEGKALPASCEIAEVGRTGRTVIAQAACLVEDEEKVQAALRANGFEEIEPEEQSISIAEYVELRTKEVARLRAEFAEADAALRDFAAKQRRRVELALGYWEERLAIANSAAMMARSRRLTVLKGYVREHQLEAFRLRIERELPEVALVARDPGPEEKVPVSLRNPKFFRPASFLVSMFGLPNYRTFDPTPVIFFSFLLFFGFCFGDVVYGVLLVALGVLLARKYREYTNLRNFFNLLTYAGVPTIIVGALTGSWAADLPMKFLDEGNPVRRLVAALTVTDPVNKALGVLVLCLMIGMLNQVLAIVMLMVRNLKQGEVRAAIFDGAFWLLLLPGFSLLVAGMFATLPGPLRHTAWGLCIAGGGGLVLTQGRAEKSLIGKIVIGVVSLYGIVGTYGLTTYIGDTLSYSRLLALGLTTGIVGLSFNMIAKMAGDIPMLGPVILIVILLAGHGLNFVVSILGGFVHSARLTFVEFFGRFYDGGAPPFAPLGAWRGRIRVTDRATVWTE